MFSHAYQSAVRPLSLSGNRGGQENEVSANSASDLPSEKPILAGG